MLLSTQQSITQEVHIPELMDRNIRLLVKRDDLIHNEVSGNKWRKLKYNLEQCVSLRKEGVLTFGGAFSNHLLATASACKLAGLKSIGIVRGEELNVNSNDTLSRCAELGMQLLFVTRDEYLLKEEKQYLEELQLKFPGFYLVPEGGSNYLGMIGCQEILSEIEVSPDIIVVAAGTSTTAAGICLSLDEMQRLWVVPVLKSYSATDNIRALLSRTAFESDMIEDYLERVTSLEEYHFGGYAKYDNTLLDLIEESYFKYELPLDPIYTGKAFYGLLNEVKKQDVKNTIILFIHTGGLQGAKEIFQKEKRAIY
ncbi:MAG: pyridoxal-phosphate dependent enzyme [Bacteroidetes bacterium]|nr:MAG: pyridoxal-phosphate dependent enzyme [Bacteroidota bacterium]